MNAATKIRDAVGAVAQLRQAAERDARLAFAVREIKRLQAQRFAASYADLLQGTTYAPAARFFLEELYGDKDYAERDAQFARIAGAIEKLFPAQVARTAASLAQLHALTEDLDHAMAQSWLAGGSPAAAARYLQCWRAVGRRAEREQQLSVVIEVGRELTRITRTPGLRMMLRMMRGAAAAAGMGTLQRFLETGFDTFAALAKQERAAEHFLGTIRQREHALMDRWFDSDAVACETELAQLLGQAR